MAIFLAQQSLQHIRSGLAAASPDKYTFRTNRVKYEYSIDQFQLVVK